MCSTTSDGCRSLSSRPNGRVQWLDQQSNLRALLWRQGAQRVEKFNKGGFNKTFPPCVNLWRSHQDCAISARHSLDVNQLNLPCNLTQFSGLPSSDSTSALSTTSNTASASISFK